MIRLPIITMWLLRLPDCRAHQPKTSILPLSTVSVSMLWRIGSGYPLIVLRISIRVTYAGYRLLANCAIRRAITQLNMVLLLPYRDVIVISMYGKRTVIISRSVLRAPSARLLTRRLTLVYKVMLPTS